MQYRALAAPLNLYGIKNGSYSARTSKVNIGTQHTLNLFCEVTLNQLSTAFLVRFKAVLLLVHNVHSIVELLVTIVHI